ncbi:MAG: AAA family ATPase [Mizugakiibacter sp.]|uniref:ATP-dependent nuclease n=1 Tax=Mizugakiibacter sp. TaxID=1972610 RepID=UPI0031C69053|nr:AAA family ATPase [Xanthomonadaceae bacterium]
MARIRKVEIRNFRSIRALDWFPNPGVNCLIGPGDSGKSTILDAIDFCLGARRSVALSDTDFYNLDVGQAISITVTLGALPDALQNLDTYGDFLRSYHAGTRAIEEEPQHGWETVLSVNVLVGADLEPVWTLASAQAQAAGIERGLRWADRVAIAPARLGNYLNAHLGWTRGSVLNRLSDDAVQLGPRLAQAARQARASFGQAASEPLRQVLDEVNRQAQDLGILVGQGAQALLDAHSVSIGDGAVALHNDAGVPLRSLGTGSARLLIAGLQRAAFRGQAGIVLVDEVETGLEPHRLQRLLMSLGAKDDAEPMQVFLTTHSPVAVRELDARQIWVIRPEGAHHQAHWAGRFPEAQGTARATPEAMLAKTVILCEGASEVGLVRGLDMYWAGQNCRSLLSAGAIAVSVGGSFPEKGFQRGVALSSLGYKTIVLVDSDKPINPADVAAHAAAGGRHVQWDVGRATEHELFLSLDDDGVALLIERATELHGRRVVDDHIRTRTDGQWTLEAIDTAKMMEGFQPHLRQMLGNVAHKSGWFKQQGIFEDLARDIVGLRYAQASEDFRQRIHSLFSWAHEH